jgi:hypothetical protein
LIDEQSPEHCNLTQTPYLVNQQPNNFLTDELESVGIQNLQIPEILIGNSPGFLEAKRKPQPFDQIERKTAESIMQEILHN